MRPEIEAYLHEHGPRYTTEALRQQLIDARHDPAEVDAALRESEAWRAPQLAEARGSRSRFWWSVFGLHLAVLVGVSVWVFTRNYTYAPFAAVILGLMLLGGLGISGLIGRMLQPRGLMAALIVPLISALGLGGLCLATISGTQIHVPPRPGVMELTIDPPLSFEGSGPAECFIPQGGFSVYAPDLGTLEGRLVSVSLNSAGDPASQASSGSYRTVHLSVNLLPRTGEGPGGETAYGRLGDGTVELDAPSDGLSGTLSFEGLVAQEFDGAVTGPPISGTLSWTCE